MKKLTTISAILFLFAVSCKKADAPQEQDPIANHLIAGRNCAADEVFQQQLLSDPTFRERVNEIEAFTQRVIRTGAFNKSADGATIEGINIPIVVHVLYNTAEENISDAQIQSQIDVLNEDFNLQNRDNSRVPSYFEDEKANIGIRFTLAQVIRKQTNKTSFGINNDVKRRATGGSDAVDPSTYLNLWSCNLRDYLGYAQFPGGNQNTDGVVILYSSVGSRAKNRQGTYIRNYDLGRTATHEIGHWMNLRHIWGDAKCGNDYVGDTPLHDSYNVGCPKEGEKSTCTGTPVEMWMNYMDYTYDACMYMFTNGQKERMLSVFAPGGPRAQFAR